MKSQLKRLLPIDFISFARKAIRELDGTRVSTDRYLEFLATYLMAFANGMIKRLLINLPPRYLKTYFCTVCLAAWILAHDPSTKIMILCCSEELAENCPLFVPILAAEWYREAFPTRLKKGHGKVRNFATTAGGEVFAASINGIITGYGADVIITDDPRNLLMPPSHDNSRKRSISMTPSSSHV